MQKEVKKWEEGDRELFDHETEYKAWKEAVEKTQKWLGDRSKMRGRDVISGVHVSFYF